MLEGEREDEEGAEVWEKITLQKRPSSSTLDTDGHAPERADRLLNLRDDARTRGRWRLRKGGAAAEAGEGGVVVAPTP